MDAIRKQAKAFREQVAKQQQAVLKQFSGHGSQGDMVITDEAELLRHQQLERLYISTKAAKHYQREIVRELKALCLQVSSNWKLHPSLQMIVVNMQPKVLALGVPLPEPLCTLELPEHRWRERDNLHRSIGTQVADPLRAMVMGAPLEDARHLTQRYERLRQEAEAQAAEVGRRQFRNKEVGGNVDNTLKLQTAEQKMGELTSAMAVLGKEAAAAMTAVEAQQQRLTLQRLIAMVEAERSYHQRVAEILDQLQAQMVSERQRSESNSTPGGNTAASDMYMPPPSYEDVKSNGGSHNASEAAPVSKAAQKAMYFLAEVMHDFEAEDQGELSLTVGDYVVVRQVSPTGWSEGECKGKAGWFPSLYVERRQRIPARKVADASPGV